MQSISAISILVPDYDEAINYYVGILGFVLVEDTKLSDLKRWVLVSPTKDHETCLLLAKAASAAQTASIGNQAGGRVFLLLETDDFERDYEKYQRLGVKFLEEPRHEPYGIVAVFKDVFGNKWDLIERTKVSP
ncbi:MAG: VOC family protein [Alphaproteobacteria bacterium]|jgi:catechol 2,3-dioxygenase-like lactoylglutathione lyase family enzyme|nr:VOC family protein [Alphaproteobacteria bacterium]